MPRLPKGARPPLLIAAMAVALALTAIACRGAPTPEVPVEEVHLLSCDQQPASFNDCYRCCEQQSGYQFQDDRRDCRDRCALAGPKWSPTALPPKRRRR